MSGVTVWFICGSREIARSSTDDCVIPAKGQRISVTTPDNSNSGKYRVKSVVQELHPRPTGPDEGVVSSSYVSVHLIRIRKVKAGTKR